MHVTGLRCVILMSLLATTGLLRAQPAGDTAAAESPVQEIVVEGRHEGPRLWTVRTGDHTVWILGTISPLPKKMVWQPDAVRAVLRETQEVVPAWPTYGIGAHPLTALRVYIEWRRLQKPPDNLPLSESLPPQLYARVEALKARYDPKDSKLEHMRPMLAARQLISRVFDAAGLAQHNEVQETVLQLAREQGVRVHQDKLKIDDPVDVLKDVGKTLLETDLAPMQARAQAWALGDVEALRKLPHAGDRTACMAAVSNSERVRNLIARAQDDWLIAVEASLQRNRGTLAVQSMDRLLGEHGALAALRAKGYTVAGP